MSSFTECTLSCQRLLLDPNNYRYQDSSDFVHAEEKRFHEESVQDRAFRRLKSEETLVQLKNSFLTNGFIPVERLVVRPYTYAEGLYLVLEGNRRLAALRWIADDNAAGVDVPKSLLQALKALPVVVVDNADTAFYECLMGIRHVSGIKQWGGYQSAKLIAALRDTHGLTSANVADRLGVSAQEVNRRYRAFKALQQMQQDDEFGGYATPETYPVFHEAVSLPVVRGWLGWDEPAACFTKDEERRQFYELVTPMEGADTESRKAKICTFSDVRELRNILPDPEAKRVLLDPSRSFVDALTITRSDELTRSWATQVAEAIIALKNIGAIDLSKFTAEDIAQIERLRDVAIQIVETHKKLKA